MYNINVATGPTQEEKYFIPLDDLYILEISAVKISAHAV